MMHVCKINPKLLLHCKEFVFKHIGTVTQAGQSIAGLYTQIFVMSWLSENPEPSLTWQMTYAVHLHQHAAGLKMSMNTKS